MIMPALLLQKPSKSSKSKDHVAALQRRLDLWDEGNILELIEEGETIQGQLKHINAPQLIADISKKFKEKMSKGNINGAIKLLTNNMGNGILPLNEETIRQLREKHPTSKEASSDILLRDKPTKVHPVRYEEITPDLIRQSALKTKGGSGPSGLDGDGWKRVLTSNSFGQNSVDLCVSVAALARKICTDIHSSASLEALMACRLIPLNKNPGMRPIGVGEVQRRIIGKTVARVLKPDIVNAIGSLQVCAGQDAGCEAAVHAVRTTFEQETTEAVILLDAANAFNNVNRNAFLHNVKIICPSISSYVENCYNTPSRLFVIGGIELQSSEGTT